VPDPEETERETLARVIGVANIRYDGYGGSWELALADALLAARRLSEPETPREAITDAEVNAVAHVMFEPPTGGSGDYTWAEMVREDPTRADMWRTDARAALEAARAAKETDRG